MNIRFPIISALSLGLGFAVWLPSGVRAAELKEAQVTQVIQDVRLLPSNASPRPASVSDRVHEDTAVRTGVESRTELTFQDMTITRLGSQTIFSFKGGTRTINLKSGSILLSVPKRLWWRANQDGRSDRLRHQDEDRNAISSRSF